MDIESFEFYLIQEKGLRPKTVRGYLIAIKSMQKETGLNESNLKRFLLHKLTTVSIAAYNKYTKTLRHYYRFIELECPKFVTVLKEQPKPRQLFTDDEINQIIDIDPPPSKYGMYWKLLSFTGQRTYEIAQLKRSDIDITRNCIYIDDTKRGQTRDIPIHEAVAKDLITYVNVCRSEYLFPPRTKRHPYIQSADINKNLKSRLKRLGITKDAKPYSFRHSFITNTLDEGAQLLDIMAMVGHKNPSTTLNYKKSNLKGKRKAIQFLPLGNTFLDPIAIFSKFIEHVSQFHLSPEHFIVSTARTESSFSLSITLRHYKE